MRKHCGNCANYKKETSQFSEECGKCVSARLENGETTDPSHWRALPQTNADRIRAMTDEELAVFVRAVIMAEDCPVTGCDCDKCFFKEVCFNGSKWYGKEMEWLKQPAEE